MDCFCLTKFVPDLHTFQTTPLGSSYIIPHFPKYAIPPKTGLPDPKTSRTLAGNLRTFRPPPEKSPRIWGQRIPNSEPKKKKPKKPRFLRFLKKRAPGGLGICQDPPYQRLIKWPVVSDLVFLHFFPLKSTDKNPKKSRSALFFSKLESGNIFPGRFFRFFSVFFGIPRNHVFSGIPRNRVFFTFFGFFTFLAPSLGFFASRSGILTVLCQGFCQIPGNFWQLLANFWPKTARICQSWQSFGKGAPEFLGHRGVFEKVDLKFLTRSS